MTIISLKGQEFRISIGIGVKFTIYKSTQQQAAMIPIADSMKASSLHVSKYTLCASFAPK